jgi:hypothetical protein
VRQHRRPAAWQAVGVSDTPGPDRHPLERLWPAPWVWLSILVVAGFCAVVVLPFGGTAGLLGFAVPLLVMAAVLLRGSPLVGVRDGEFVAGRAHVAVGLVGEVTVLDAPAMRHAAGPGLDARAHLCLRGWVRAGLRLDLVDPQDPTPYWLVSSRRPERLAAAVAECRRAG